MISYEPHRRYGVEQKHKIVEILPKAQSCLKKYRAEHCEKVQASEKRALAAAQKKQVAKNRGRKKCAKK